MPSPHSHHVPPIADALAPFVTIICAAIVSLAVMDLCGLNVGVNIDAALKIAWEFGWRAALVIAGIVGTVLVLAAGRDE